MTEKVARRPDLRIKVLRKSTGEQLRDAGVAWINKDGSVSVKLSPCVVLSSDPDLVITMFPASGASKNPCTDTSDQD